LACCYREIETGLNVDCDLLLVVLMKKKYSYFS
jgi:hypothetical protein